MLHHNSGQFLSVIGVLHYFVPNKIPNKKFSKFQSIFKELFRFYIVLISTTDHLGHFQKSMVELRRIHYEIKLQSPRISNPILLNYYC